MTKKKTDTVTERRAALKKILSVSGVVAATQAVPDKWTKPLVESILLPAHATATRQPNFAGPVTLNLGGITEAPGSGILDAMVPTAHASAPMGVGGELCLFVVGTSFNAILGIIDFAILTGSGTVAGGNATLSAAPNCPVAKPEFLRVINTDESFAYVSLNGGPTQQVPIGVCNLPSSCPEED